MGISFGTYLRLNASKSEFVDGPTRLDPGTASVVNLRAQIDAKLTGIKGGVEGRLLMLINVGATLDVMHYYDADASREPTEGIACESGTFQLPANGLMLLVHHGGLWRHVR
jgi:hypothetical protein